MRHHARTHHRVVRAAKAADTLAPQNRARDDLDGRLVVRGLATMRRLVDLAIRTLTQSLLEVVVVDGGDGGLGLVTANLRLVTLDDLFRHANLLDLPSRCLAAEHALHDCGAVLLLLQLTARRIAAVDGADCRRSRIFLHLLLLPCARLCTADLAAVDCPNF